MTYTYNPVGGNDQNYNNVLSQIVINFNTPLNTEIIPAAANFSVTANGQSIAVTGVLAVTNNSVTLQLANPATSYTVTYTPGSAQLTNLQTSENQQIAAFSIESNTAATTTGIVNSTAANTIPTNQLIANLENDFAQDSPPALALTSSGDILLGWSSDSAYLLAPISAIGNGNTLYVSFGQDLANDETSQTLPTASQFVVTVNGVVQSLNPNEPPTVSGNTLALTLNQAIAATDTVTVSYNLAESNTTNLNFVDPTATTLWIQSFSDLAVTIVENVTVAPALL